MMTFLISCLTILLQASKDCGDFFASPQFTQTNTGVGTYFTNFVYQNSIDVQVAITEDCTFNNNVLVTSSSNLVSITITALTEKVVLSNYAIVVQGFMNVNLNQLKIQATYISMQATQNLALSQITIANLNKSYYSEENDFKLKCPPPLINQLKNNKNLIPILEDQSQFPELPSYNQKIRTNLPCSIYLEAGHNLILNILVLNSLSSGRNLSQFDIATQAILMKTIIPLDMNQDQNILYLVAKNTLIITNLNIVNCSSFYSSGRLIRSKSLITIYASNIISNNLYLSNSFLLRSKFIEIETLGVYKFSFTYVQNCTTLITQLFTFDQLMDSQFSQFNIVDIALYFDNLVISDVQINPGLPMEKFLSAQFQFRVHLPFFSVIGQKTLSFDTVTISNNNISVSDIFYLFGFQNTTNVHLHHIQIVGNTFSVMFLDLFSTSQITIFEVDQFKFNNSNTRDIGYIFDYLSTKSIQLDKLLYILETSLNQTGQPSLKLQINGAFQRMMPMAILNTNEVFKLTITNMNVSCNFVLNSLVLLNQNQPINLEISNIEYSNSIKYNPFSCAQAYHGNFMQVDGPFLKINIQNCIFKNLNIYDATLMQIIAKGQIAQMYQDSNIHLLDIIFVNVDLIILQDYLTVSVFYLDSDPVQNINIVNMTFNNIAMHSIPQQDQGNLNYLCNGEDSNRTSQLVQQYVNVELSAPLILIISPQAQIIINNFFAKNITSRQNYGGLYLICNTLNISNSQFVQFNQHKISYNIEQQSLGGCLYIKSPKSFTINNTSFKNLFFVQGAAITVSTLKISLSYISFINIDFYHDNARIVSQDAAVVLKDILSINMSAIIIRNLQQGQNSAFIAFQSVQKTESVWVLSNIKIILPKYLHQSSKSAYLINFIDQKIIGPFSQINITSLTLVGDYQQIYYLINLFRANLMMRDVLISNLQISGSLFLIQHALQVSIYFINTIINNISLSNQGDNSTFIQLTNQLQTNIITIRSYFLNLRSQENSRALFQQNNYSNATFDSSLFSNLSNIYLINQLNCTLLNITNSVFVRFNITDQNFTLSRIQNSNYVIVNGSTFTQFIGQQLININHLGYAFMILETLASFQSNQYLNFQGGVLFFSNHNSSTQQPLYFGSSNDLQQCYSQGPSIVILFPNVSKDLFSLNPNEVAYFPNQIDIDIQLNALSETFKYSLNQNSTLALNLQPGTNFQFRASLSYNSGTLSKKYYSIIYPEMNFNFQKTSSEQITQDLSSFEYSSQSIFLYSNTMNNDFISFSTNYTQESYLLCLNISFSACQQGHVLSQNKSCQKCLEGTCSYDGIYCSKCPDNSQCSEGIISELNPGFWRPDSLSVNVVQCSNNIANCNNDTNLVGFSCQEGTCGPLCETCDFHGTFSNVGHKYFRGPNFTCIDCKKLKNNTYRNILAAIFSFVSLLLSMNFTFLGIQTNIVSRYLKTMGFITLGVSGMPYISGSYVKILVTHLQIFCVMKNFKGQQNGSLSFIQNLGQILGDVSYAFSLDCFITDWFGSHFSVQSSILIIQAALPFILFIIQSILIMLISLIRRKRINIQDFIFSSVYIYFFMITNLSESLISYTACRSISGQLYAKSNLTQFCFGSNHVKIVSELIIPLMIFYLLIYPYFTFYRLRARNNIGQLRLIPSMLSMGFIYLEYRDLVYYFELIKLIQKIMLTIITNQFDSDHFYMSQSLIVLLVIIHQITAWLKPYDYFKLVTLDQISSQILVCSIMLAYISEQTLIQNIRLITLVLTTFLNLTFFILVIRQILFIRFLQIDDIIHPLKQRILVKLKMKVNDKSRASFIRKQWKTIYKQIYCMQNRDIKTSELQIAQDVDEAAKQIKPQNNDKLQTIGYELYNDEKIEKNFESQGLVYVHLNQNNQMLDSQRQSQEFTTQDFVRRNILELKQIYYTDV